MYVGGDIGGWDAWDDEHVGGNMKCVWMSQDTTVVDVLQLVVGYGGECKGGKDVVYYEV